MIKEKKWPSLVVRMKAGVIDSVLIIIFMMFITEIFSYFTNVSDNIRMLAFVFIFVFYDPIFVSVFGGTVGHMMQGVSVRKDKNTQKKIIFPLAIIRFVVKVLLGWLSLLTVTSSKKKKAIHDYLVGSVVVYEELKDC